MFSSGLSRLFKSSSINKNLSSAFKCNAFLICHFSHFKAFIMVELLKIITYFYKTLEIMIEYDSMKKMNHTMGMISKKLLFRD